MKGRRLPVGLAAAFLAILPAHAMAAQERETADEARKRLSQVRVAVLYENVTDGVLIGRSKADTIKLLKETRADLVLRCFWKWMPVVESPDRIPPQLLELGADRGVDVKQAADGLRRSGHTYDGLREWISAIKAELPSIIFCGAVPAQTLSRVELNPVTGKVYGAEETWRMALDPQKWKLERDGKPLAREAFQELFYGHHPYAGKVETYDRRKVAAYFPDLTNTDFQDLMLSWAKKQIDCGADAIWIDMLSHQAARLAQITRDFKHPAVRESLEAATKIVEEIHKYGTARGRAVLVGSWDSIATRIEDFSRPAPPVDFVTVSPLTREAAAGKLDAAHWEKRVAAIRKAQGDIPVFAYIDWSFDESPTVAFSQKLDKEGQREALRNFDRSFADVGINFVYPLHGGYMGRGEVTQRLAFGKHRIYDSLAPEFDTYETIRELAQKKAGGGR